MEPYAMLAILSLTACLKPQAFTRERKIYDYGSIRLRYAAKTPDTAREAQASYERH